MALSVYCLAVKRKWPGQFSIQLDALQAKKSLLKRVVEAAGDEEDEKAC